MYMTQHHVIRQFPFNTIHFNYPHHPSTKPSDIKPHQMLLLKFFMQSSYLLTEDGMVRVLLHSTKPYATWNLVQLAESAGFKLKGEVKFEKSKYNTYTPKKGFGDTPDGNFDTGESLFYEFVLGDKSGGSSNLKSRSGGNWSHSSHKSGQISRPFSSMPIGKEVFGTDLGTSATNSHDSLIEGKTYPAAVDNKKQVGIKVLQGDREMVLIDANNTDTTIYRVEKNLNEKIFENVVSQIKSPVFDLSMVAGCQYVADAENKAERKHGQTMQAGADSGFEGSKGGDKPEGEYQEVENEASSL